MPPHTVNKSVYLLMALAYLRELARRPSDFLLAVVGLSMGVAAFVAIDMSIYAAKTSFKDNKGLIEGKVTHRIISSSSYFDADIYRLLKLRFGDYPMAPIIDAKLDLLEPNETREVKQLNNNKIKNEPSGSANNTRLIGVDVFAEMAMSRFNSVLVGSGEIPWLDLLNVYPSAMMYTNLDSKEAADHSQLVSVRLADGRSNKPVELNITRYLISPNFSNKNNWLIADMATAEKIIGNEGVISYIDLDLSSVNLVRLKQLRAFVQTLSPSLVLINLRQQQNSLRGIAESFELNMRMLSVLAMLVGAFMVFQVTQFNILRRVTHINYLNIIGFTKHQCVTMLLIEVVLLASLSTLVGIIIGWLGALTLLNVVSVTSTQLIYGGETSSLFSPVYLGLLLKAMFIGVGVALVASAYPVWQIYHIRGTVTGKRHYQEQASAKFNAGRIIISVLAFIAFVTSLLIPGQKLEWAYVSLIALVVGYISFLLPLFRQIIALLLTRFRGKRTYNFNFLVLTNLRAHLGRIGVAACAMTIAIAAAFSINQMVNSFEQTFVRWLQTTLPGDIYISVPNRPGMHTILETSLDEIAQLPEVTFIAKSSDNEAFIFHDNVKHTVWLKTMDSKKYRGIRMLEGNLETIATAKPNVLVSEEWCYKHNVKNGDVVTLMTDRGLVALTVSGVFQNFGTRYGIFIINQENYKNWYNQHTISAAAIYLKSPKKVNRVFDEINKIVHDQKLRLSKNSVLLDNALTLFNHTFKVTYVIGILALVVAALGIATAIATLLLERRNEILQLNILGMEKASISRLLSYESSLTGLYCGIMSVPLGIMMAWLLVEYILQRAFGWRIDLLIQWQDMILVIVSATILSAVAALWPARNILRQVAENKSIA